MSFREKSAWISLLLLLVLGGIVARVGDTVIDGSVRSRLEQLKNAI